MVDTQWPRFQVFVQEKEGLPHQDAGSVHAPDREMALLNARDVFARRPECASMWVVPVEAIYAKTAQELREQGIEPGAEGQMNEAAVTYEPYCVFYKAKPAGTHTLVGNVDAPSPAQALKAALAHFPFKQPPFSWWVFPRRLVTASDPAEIESLYAPARDKLFRMSTDFHTHTAMRQIKKK
jgi:ring-1,2-phenylacetyl-CoA epoxidase subunit PaaB